MAKPTPVINDILSEFQSMREALAKERQALESRLMQIDEALGQTAFGRTNHRQNSMSLKEAVIQVTTARALTRQEVLEEVQKLGYKFSTPHPLNSINVVLYGKKPKFKRVDGKFSFSN